MSNKNLLFRFICETSLTHISNSILDKLMSQSQNGSIFLILRQTNHCIVTMEQTRVRHDGIKYVFISQIWLQLSISEKRTSPMLPYPIQLILNSRSNNLQQWVLKRGEEPDAEMIYTNQHIIHGSKTVLSERKQWYKIKPVTAIKALNECLVTKLSPPKGIFKR